MESSSPHRPPLPSLRSDLLPRPQLQARLAEALAGCKVVLLVAAAGYGKTVALASALAGLPEDHAVAWTSANDSDDLPGMLARLLAALDPFDLPWRVSPAALPVMIQRPGGLAAAVDELAHALEQSDARRGVIAIDDVHRFADARVFECFDRLLAAMPSNWVLALTSRVGPPMSLARMTMAGEVTEFREEDLRFGRGEVKALLDAARLPSSDESADLLLRRTQGWPVGLSIELLALRGAARDSRAQWRTFEYLAEEVLGQLPEALQDFLLRCSVLPELSAQRCVQVSGDPQAAHWLDELERRGLFVTFLEGDELRLRLHDLFRDFLQKQVSRRMPAQWPELLRRAAIGEPDVMQRVGYLLRAGDDREAAQQMLGSASALIHSGAGEQLMRQMERFPEPVRSTSPELAFVRGMVAHFRLQYEPMLASLLQAISGFEQAGQWPLATLSRALACAAQYCAGQPSKAFELWDAAPRRERDAQGKGLEAVVDLARSAFFGPYRDTPHKAWQLVMALPLIDAEGWMPYLHTRHMSIGRWGMRAPMVALADALSSMGGDSRPQLKLAALQLRAWLALWRADLDQARALSLELVAEARWLGNPPYAMGFNAVLSAFERHLCGDHARAKGVLMAVADGAGRRTLPGFWSLCHAASLCAAAEDWAGARELLASIDSLDHTPQWPFLMLEAAIVRAELMLHDKQAVEAAAALRPYLAHAMDWDNHGSNARLRVSLARAELACGDAAAAWAALEPALAMAMENQEPLGLLLCGPAALMHLAQAHWPESVDSSSVVWLRACSQRARQMHRPEPEAASASAGVPDTTLSERELQVVELVAQGQSNKLIARGLGLSPHTVKRHMARILEKTGLASRGRLAQWHRSGHA